MPLDITFTLSDRDLERFKAIINSSRHAAEDQQGQLAIESSARKIVDLAMNADLPDFIASRLLQLKTLLQMMQDKEWGLAENEKARIMSALSYFANPADLIPDHIPGIGFLDDAIFVEIVISELAQELSAYNEFCDYRSAEESRLQAEGADITADRESWLREKRDSLQAQLRAQRQEDGNDEFTFHFL
jgi:uncharacterized membrane protein YkvA (DUF1232 family)